MPDVFGGNDLAFEDVEEVDDPNDDDFEWDDEEVVDEDAEESEAGYEDDAEESEDEAGDEDAESEDEGEDAEESEAEDEDGDEDAEDDFSDWGFGEGDDDWEDPEEDAEEGTPEDEDPEEDEDEDSEEDAPEDEDPTSGHSDAEEEDGTDWVSDGNTQIAQGTSLESAIKGISGGFKITRGRIAIPSDLALLEFVKESRNETHQGLTQSIQEMGQLTPIVVMQSTSYAMYLSEHDGDPEGFEGKKYILIDGLRRLYSMVKLRFDYAEVCVFEFEDPDKGSEVAPLLRWKELGAL